MHPNNPFAQVNTPQMTQATSAQPAATAVPATPLGGPANDPFASADPAPQAPRAPRLRELYGRLLILAPLKLETGIVSKFKNNDGTPVIQDRLTADLIVLDGGTIHYGGTPEKVPPVPHDRTAEPPQKWERVYISSAGIVSQCRLALAQRLSGTGPGLVIGRLTRGEDTGKGEPPWLLQVATDQDKALGKRYLEQIDPFHSG